MEESKRQLRVGNLIKDTLGQMLSKHSGTWFGSAMLTVMNVRLTSDLQIARVYISVFNTEDKQGIIDVLNENGKTIRGDLGNSLRHSLRNIPSLEFYLDDTLDHVDRMNKLFDDLSDK